MGKPTAGNAAVRRTEYIGANERTEGSETSQYLEEKKTNVIPRVVASESGTGQTGRRNSSGVEGPCFFFKQKTAYEIGLGIPAEPLFRSLLEGFPFIQEPPSGDLQERV